MRRIYVADDERLIAAVRMMEAKMDATLKEIKASQERKITKMDAG
jgi:hypothetical protein